MALNFICGSAMLRYAAVATLNSFAELTIRS
jgi:hypothetical protein